MQTKYILSIIFFSSTMLFIHCSEEKIIGFGVIDGECIELELDSRAVFEDNEGEGFLFAYYSELKYPALARENGIEGEVIINYIISKEGFVLDPEITMDIGGGCGEAAVNALLEVCPGDCYTPAYYNGQVIDSKEELFIRFKLE